MTEVPYYMAFSGKKTWQTLIEPANAAFPASILSMQAVNTFCTSFAWPGYDGRTHTWWSVGRDIVYEEWKSSPPFSTQGPFLSLDNPEHYQGHQLQTVMCRICL